MWGRGDSPSLPEGRFLAANQTVTPRVHLFAEPVVARVDVIVDSERYDPDRIRLIPGSSRTRSRATP